MRWQLAWTGIIAAALAGCRGPLQAITQSRAVIHNSPVEDRGPLTERTVLPGDQSGEKIAIVDVDGLLLNTPMAGLGSLGENPVALLREKLDCAAADPCYRAVVLRINSPGGGVTATDIMWQEVQRFKRQTQLPVVACLMDVGAGGAYYVATAADQIVAHPTTITGGIGVILNLYNLQDTLMQFNILGTPVKAGRHIDVGSPLAPLDDEARQILQSIADQYHKRFQEIVQTARPRHDPQRTEDFDGRVFLAPEALERGLIDRIGYLDDAVAVAREMGRCPLAPALMLHRANDPARSPYAVTPNMPLQGSLLPLSVPGFDRTQMPAFLYLWQPEPTLERRAAGR